VVAGEIRTLASRTASAADEIRHVVEGLQAETRDAVVFMNHGGENVDASLRQAEQGASENMRLQQAVERMFGPIKQWISAASTMASRCAESMRCPRR